MPCPCHSLRLNRLKTIKRRIHFVHIHKEPNLPPLIIYNPPSLLPLPLLPLPLLPLPLPNSRFRFLWYSFTYRSHSLCFNSAKLASSAMQSKYSDSLSNSSSVCLDKTAWLNGRILNPYEHKPKREWVSKVHVDYWQYI